MINQAFGRDKNSLPFPLDRIEVVDALLKYDSLRDATTAKRAVAWCNYLDARDRQVSGYYAGKWAEGSLPIFGFIEECHRFGWTHVKPRHPMAQISEEQYAAALSLRKMGVGLPH